MYTLKDNGLVQEIECGNNFAYVLSDNSKFVNTDYKVLQSQTNDIFVKTMKMTYNGKTEMFYMTDEYRPMASMFTGISSEILMTIIANLFNAIIEVKNNGFLNCQNIDISWDKIFVNPNTLRVKLVYIPVNYKAFNSYAEFESELRAGLIKLIGKIIVAPDKKTEQFLLDLSNSSLSLKDLYARTKGNSPQTGYGESENPTVVLKSNMKSVSQYKHIPGSSGILRGERAYSSSDYLKLVAADAPGHFEILLDQPDMLLGKKQGLVDAVIPFNNMISRKHCRIMNRNGKYIIRDEGSSNHTYVNGHRLNPGEECEFRRGDVIRMANSDFNVE